MLNVNSSVRYPDVFSLPNELAFDKYCTHFFVNYSSGVGCESNMNLQTVCFGLQIFGAHY
jgi:hypothetical protein